MNQAELELLERYIDGKLSEADADPLRLLLRESSEARAKLRTLATIEYGLQDLAAGAPLPGSPDLPLRATKDEVASPPPRHSSRVAWWPYSLAASLAVAAAITWFSLGPGGAVQAAPIAHLSYQHDAHWSRPLEVGSPLGAETLKLDAGLAKLEFASGACVTFEGPAVLEIVGPNQALLHSGVLTAHVPPAAVGFSIETPALKVVDRGTAFGVSVGNDGLTNVSVFEGEIDVNAKGQAATQRVLEGQAVRTARDSATLESIELEAKPFEQVWPVNSGVLETTGPLKFVSPGPSFVPGRYEDAEHIIVFPERRGLVLESPVPVDLAEPGKYVRHRSAQFTVPAGRRIRTYLVQVNTVRRVEDKTAGQITFDRPILGVAVMGLTLRNTDQALGHPNGDYAASRRGLEPPNRRVQDNRDEVVLSEDRRTLQLNFAKGATDQIRVLVDDAEPDWNDNLP